MLDTKTYAYNVLKNNAALVAGLGGDATKIQFNYPNDFNSLPIVTYREANSTAVDFWDDVPAADDSVIAIDVWANVSTTALSKLVDSAMVGAYYTREYAEDVPDPDAKIFHKALRYRRKLTADDIDLV